MSNGIDVPNLSEMVSRLSQRVYDLERRVLALGDDTAEEGGCCTVLCCNDAPADALAASDDAAYCTVALEETAGVALRLAVVGLVVVRADGTGTVSFDAAAEVNGDAYLERARFTIAMATNEIVTCPVVNTIDTNVPDPSVSIRVRNIGATALTVLRVNLQVLVYGVRDGSTACGEPSPTS